MPADLTGDPHEFLVQAALEARARAYAPYSRFKVGAALQLKDGRIVSGANVENCSYGLALCAERTAVVSAVMQGMQPGDIAAVAVAAEATETVAPCGACRQVLAEFAPAATVVVMHNVRTGARLTMRMGDLLPEAFSPASLA